MLSMIPLVSVCMITYKHEKFIGEAIKSALAQKTSFEFELVIGDDCSPDNTRKIIEDFSKSFPNKVRVHFPADNLGPSLNFLETYGMCNGKYVALLEGDDYWCDVNKLQKQVNFLEANPDFSLAFHNVYYLRDSEPLKRATLMDAVHENKFDIHDLARGRLTIPTPSVMMRNILKDEVFALLANKPLGDYPLWMKAAQQGKLHYMPEEMAVYRVHQAGVWSGKSLAQRNLITINTLRAIKPAFDDAVNADLDANITALYQQAILNSLKDQDLMNQTVVAFSNFAPAAFHQFMQKQLAGAAKFEYTKKSRWYKIFQRVKKLRKQLGV